MKAVKLPYTCLPSPHLAAIYWMAGSLQEARKHIPPSAEIRVDLLNTWMIGGRGGGEERGDWPADGTREVQKVVVYKC